MDTANGAGCDAEVAAQAECRAAQAAEDDPDEAVEANCNNVSDDDFTAEEWVHMKQPSKNKTAEAGTYDKTAKKWWPAFCKAKGWDPVEKRKQFDKECEGMRKQRVEHLNQLGIKVSVAEEPKVFRFRQQHLSDFNEFFRYAEQSPDNIRYGVAK